MSSIPKIIHYCWFGGNEKPELVRQCMESWKRNCGDYQIIEWNEDNFDIQSNMYVKEAYDNRKWAFVSDYVRLFALCTYGGIYIDTDVELFQNLDCFLENDAFTGFEAKDAPITAVMGCRKGYPLFTELLNYYVDKHFVVDGELDTTTNTDIITDIFKQYGVRLNGKYQVVAGCAIFPQSFFCPNDFVNIFKKVAKKTYAVHHFMGSWGTSRLCSERTFVKRVRMYLVRKLRNIFGTDFVQKLKG